MTEEICLRKQVIGCAECRLFSTDDMCEFPDPYDYPQHKKDVL